MSTYAYRRPDKSDEIAAKDLYGEPTEKRTIAPIRIALPNSRR